MAKTEAHNNRRPPGCPQEVYDALDIFTDGELESLFAEFSWETGEFLGIACGMPGGKACAFADPARAAAIAVLNKQYKKELYGDPDGWIPVDGLYRVIPDNIVKGAIDMLQGVAYAPHNRW